MFLITRSETLITQLQNIIGNDDPALTPIYTVFALCFLFLVVVMLGKILISVLGHGR